ncbi:hypothetical protein Clacol_003088 [Clathrus columnatus]|uniref:NADP-dependent oxidoreductase domain-containing protein n=1 Tax=Clathrus columnatus TaxID=1419009 RepID=A0AAV5A5W5_9AGAM|nr:hypothetical protein Clacol_003088 [Clathrus columnatus]
MPYVRLGNSGLKVSRIILGTMQYGDPRNSPWYLTEEEAIKHIKLAYDAGIQTFDTANLYSNGESERILGKAIKTLKLPRDEIVVMTKLYYVCGRSPEVSFRSAVPGDGPEENGYVNQKGLSRKHIFESIKHSLERLQLDYVDVLQCNEVLFFKIIACYNICLGHRFDYETPIEETMQALHDVVQAGYVRYIGMSSCYAYQFHVMQNYAINNKLTPFISMQNHYSLIYREEEREMMPTLKHYGVGCIPWSPLARGILTRPLNQQTIRSDSDLFLKNGYKAPGNAEIINRVEELSKKKSISMAQVALAWSLSKHAVTAPIVGTTSLKNLQELIDAIPMRLTDEEVKYLEEPYLPQNVYGPVETHIIRKLSAASTQATTARLVYMAYTLILTINKAWKRNFKF